LSAFQVRWLGGSNKCTLTSLTGSGPKSDFISWKILTFLEALPFRVGLYLLLGIGMSLPPHLKWLEAKTLSIVHLPSWVFRQ
jgi:hypothetical protein